MWTLNHVRALSNWAVVEDEERNISRRWEWTLLALQPAEVVAETVENTRRVLGTSPRRMPPGWGNA